MDTMMLRWIGKSFLLMHADKGMDVFDTSVRELKKLTSKRKKTDEDQESIARIEWGLALYFDEEIGPFIPGFNIEMCLRDGAKFKKRGEDIKRGIQVVGEKIPLIYAGPRTRDELWEKKFRDIRGVGLGQKKIMRCRPAFKGWSLEFLLSYDPSIFDPGDLLHCAELAGRYCGIGDYIPRFGRFDVEQIEEIKNAKIRRLK